MLMVVAVLMIVVSISKRQCASQQQRADGASVIHGYLPIECEQICNAEPWWIVG